MRSKLSQRTLAALRAGDAVPDFEFDEILPPRLQEISDSQWSSVATARAMVSLLRGSSGGTRFLDIGCGPGKLCLLMALMTDLEVSGIEIRAELARIATEICEINAPGRVRVIHGDMSGLDWEPYDIFYLFNPFDENNFAPRDQGPIDRSIPLNRKTYLRYIDEVFRQLVFLRPGTRVLTFHGYGGRMPPSYERIGVESIDYGLLELWLKN